MQLTDRIIADTTCVIEGDVSELKEARKHILRMMDEEMNAPFTEKGRKWLSQLKRAERAIVKYIERNE